MSHHFTRIVAICWLFLLLDYAAAESKTLSVSTTTPQDAWTFTNGKYIGTGTGRNVYVDYVFNDDGQQKYVTLSVDAYGYSGSPTSAAPATYTIEINGQDFIYGGDQQRPIVFNNLNVNDHYRVVIMAPTSETGLIVNSVVVSRPDSPATSTPINPTSSSKSSSSTSAAGATITQSPGLSTSPLTSNGALSNSAMLTSSVGNDTASSSPGQTLGVPIFLTISGSVMPQESQTSALVSASASKSNPPVGIVLGSIAAVIVVMVLAAIVYFKRRDRARRRREQTEIDSYLVEAEAQNTPTCRDPITPEASSTMAEKSRSLFGFSDRGVAKPSRDTGQTTMVPSATAHASYITTITESSLTARPYTGIMRPESDPFASNSRISISSIEGETVAPPAYVEEETGAAPRRNQS